MKKNIFITLLGLLFGLVPSVVLGAVWYVDIDNGGTQDGTAWATAFTSIQAGIDAAFNDTGGEVWVAEGTYPEALTIKSNVTIYGGFAGSETLLSERDIESHVSVIDASTAAAGSPAKTVVTMNGIVNATIDGFTVTGGVADGWSGAEGYGGGIYAHNLDATVTIKNCRIERNNARYGGGIYVNNSSVKIENCIIVSNWSVSYGGGLFVSYGSPDLTNCVISGNESSNMAAACYLDETSAKLHNCTVSGNWANGSTGGIYISGGTPVIANCTINSNESSSYGGGVTFNYGTAGIYNTILHNNTPYGIYTSSASGLTLKNSLLNDNDQGNYISSFYDSSSGQTITQTYNGANEINLFAPDADFTYDGDPSFVTAPSGTWTAAPVFDGVTGMTSLTDSAASFVVGSLTGQLIKVSPDWRFQSLIVANTDTTISVLGNVSTITAINDPYQVIDYHLSPDSPAIDRGDPASAPLADFEGDPRPGTDSLVDIGVDETDPAYTPPPDTAAPVSMVETGPELVAGTAQDISFLASDAESGVQYVELYYRRDGGAWTSYSGIHTTSPVSFDTTTTGGSGLYEFYTLATDNNGNTEAPPVTPDYTVSIVNSFSGDRVYVDVGAAGSLSGQNWADAFVKINHALIVADAFGVGEVWVAEGTYAESVTMVSNADVYGGFGGTETVLTERDITAHQTVIDASTADNGQSAYHGVTMDTVSNVRLDGFTITGGEADGNSTETNCGGGIWGRSLDQTTEIANCTIAGNYGKGICLNAASPLITDSVIIDNQGGGIAAGNNSPVISGSTIRNNTGNGINSSGTIILDDSQILGNSNWGLYVNGGSALINRSTISGNSLDIQDGGGIRAQSITITNSRISGNRGTGLSTWSTSLMANCLVSGNSGGENGGGLVFGSGAVRNSTIAENEAVRGGGIYFRGSPVVTNTIFVGNSNLAIYEEELSADPQVTSCLFYDNPDGDYFDHDDIYGSAAGDIYSGGNAINLNVVEAEKNINGDPLFIAPVSGTWSAPPVYDANSQTTTLTDASAAFAEDALTGSLINTDITQKLQSYILANTSTTITVVGDHTDYTESLDTYWLVDYHLQDGSAALDRGDLAAAPTEDFDADVRPGTDGLIDIGFDEADAAYLPPADTDPPESNVLPIPVVTTSRSMEIPFASSDAETGAVQYVELYYRRDGGDWTLYPGQHTASPIIFDTDLTGGSGRYEFYTLGYDAAGNPEAAPAAADGYSAVIYSFAGDRIYVDINAAGLESGQDWANAFNSVTAGLIIAEAFGVPEVWVADGTYSETLVMPGNISLYGGFAGIEASLSERDFEANPTIIDASTVDGGSPALHVVRIQDVADVLLDGFIVTGGAAVSDVAEGDYGGGILVFENTGIIRIVNCTFEDNYAQYGGAIYAEASPLEIDSCIFQNNTAEYDAGGIYIYGGNKIVSNSIFENNNASSDGGAGFIEDAIIELTGSSIRNNTAEDSAGGIYFYYASGVVSDCDISGNSTYGDGGGLMIDSDYWPRPAMRIENSRITNNTAENGGGVYGNNTKPEINGTLIVGNRASFYGDGVGGGFYFDGSDPLITNSIIASNLADSEGGGISFYYSNFIIRDTVVSGNDGGEYGGGIFANYQSTFDPPHLPQLINCIVSGNRADYYGGALFLDRVNPQIVNSTISSNSVTTDGGGIYLARDALPVVTNSVFDNNTMHAVFEADSDSDLTLSYSLFFANADGDYYDFDTTTTLTGAAQINPLAEASNALEGDPAYSLGPTGSWTATPVYDPDTNITLLTDSAASFVEDELVSLLINGDTSQGRQALVASNTATTISVWGDVSVYVANIDAYQITDYHLGFGSAAIDTGTDAGAPATDLDGNPRPIDIPGTGAEGTSTEFDLGVYEYQQVDDLFITPTQLLFVSQGHESGPFSPDQWSFELENLGASSLDWTAAANASGSWLQVTPASGTLAPGETAAILLSITTAAETQSIGGYPGTLTITNTSSGTAQLRNMELQVRRDYFTEIFTADDNDLEYQTLIFIPDGSDHFYSLCRRPAAVFPTDPSGGEVRTLSDSSQAYITLLNSALVPFFGQDYNQLRVGSNGWIAFGSSPSTNSNESLTLHFGYNLISALFDDLNPAAGGQVSWKQLTDRVVVTFENVPEKNTLNNNSFQVEMFFDGVITITHLGIDVMDGLVGLSDGQGLPTDFIESNLNSYACSQGVVGFSGQAFSCSDDVSLSLSDRDLADLTMTSLTVTTGSSDSETVTMTAEGDSPGVFSGSIQTETGSASIEDGTLQVVDGDILTATYNDADDGSGSPATFIAEADIDCSLPTVTSVSSSILAYDEAEITVMTDEPVTVIIHYGTINGLPNLSQSGSNLPQTDQNVSLTGLDYNTEYFYNVEVTDAVGNSTLDDNSGTSYSLTTLSLPNLTASDLQIPPAAATGQQIPVVFTVSNIGDETALSNWNEYLYLSTDDQLGSDTTITSISRTSDLAVGANYEVNRSVTLPSVSAGVYWIIALADGANQVTELNENDNATVAGPIAIGQPNLVTSNLVVPDQAYAGGQIDVSWTVTNSGNDLAAGQWWDYVYLSADQELAGNDPYLVLKLSPGNLNISEFYDQSVTVTIPSQYSGDYYIIVKTDAGNFLNETDETDNIAVSTVMNIGQPNLTINSADAPAEVVTGQPFTVTWNVTNTGNVPVASSFYDSIYLSEDDQPGDDTPRATILHDTLLDAGSSYDGSAAVTIPSVTAGQYWLVIKADQYNNIGETSEADNTLVYGPITVTGPDLVVSAYATQAEMYTGEEVTLDWTVQNDGSGPASGTWYDRVYLSTDDQYGDDQSLDIFLQRPADLDPGASYDVTTPLTVPGVAAGTYWLVVVTDLQHHIVEVNENNNYRLYGPITIHRPNLTVSNGEIPSEAWTRQDYSISWTVTNTSTVPTVRTWQDGIYLSPDDQFGDDTELTAIECPFEPAPGQLYDRAVTVTIPELPAGDYWIFIKGDSNNVIPETDEADNIFMAGPIPVRTTPYANLQVSQAAFTVTEVDLGQQFTVDWQVSNVGTGPTSASYWKDRVYFSVDEVLDGTDKMIGEKGNVSFLNNGESYASTTIVTATGVSEGDYNVLVVTDATGEVYEYQGEDDNVSTAGQIHVSLPPPVDFIVTSVVAPTAAFSGQPFAMTYHVQNIGVDVWGSWYDHVYISEDTVLDTGSDHRIARLYREASTSRSPDPPYNIDYTANISVVPPVGISGSFYVFVMTDATNRINEWAFENNNSGYDESPISITLTPPPDLEVIDVTPAGGIMAGRPFNLSYSVRNSGATRTPNDRWIDTFYLSADGVLDIQTDKLLLQRTVTHYGDPGGLGVDQVYSRDETLTPPVETAAGSYTIFVFTDRYDQVFELDNSNNISQAAISIESQPPDLVVEAISGNSDAEAGKGLTLNWTVRNQGIGDSIISTWNDRIILTKNATVGDGDDISLDAFTHNGRLNPNQSYTATGTANVPFSLSESYYAYVRTDSSSKVFEGASGETNNTSALYPVNITRHIPDLEISGATFATDNGRLSVQWLVQNNGENRTNSNYWYDKVFASPNDIFGDEDDQELETFAHSGHLDPMGGYVSAKTFLLPASISSDVYIFVETNANRAVDEGGLYENNVMSAGLLSADVIDAMRTMPDLVVDSVATPLEAVSGQLFDLTWTVKNIGEFLPHEAPFPPEAAKGAWIDRIYLSRDTFLDPAVDTFLGQEVIYAGDLNDVTEGEGAPYQTYSKTASLRVPDGLTGPFYVIVSVDRSNLVAEAGGEDNNNGVNSQAMLVSLAPMADMVVGTITIPADVSVGSRLTLEYTLENLSDYDITGDWWDLYYLSTDAEIDINDVELGINHRFASSTPLPAHGTLDISTYFNLPGVVPGQYYVILYTDAFNQVRETDDLNNFGVSDSQVNVEMPSLATPYPDGLAPIDAELTWLNGGRASFYFTFTAADGAAVTLSPEWQSSEGDTRHTQVSAYVAQGRVPTPEDYDHVEANFLVSGLTDAISTAPLTMTGLAAGDYYVLLKLQALGMQEFEPARSEVFNLIIDPLQTITKIAVEIDVGELRQQQTKGYYYYFDTPAGRTLMLEPNWLYLNQKTSHQENVLYDRAALTKIYVAYNRIATPYDYDFTEDRFLLSSGYSQPNFDNPLIIPKTKAGSYFVFVEVHDAHSPWSVTYINGNKAIEYTQERFNVILSELPFSVLAVEPSTVGNTGKATLEIIASNLDLCSIVELVQSEQVIRSAEDIFVPDYEEPKAYVRFDLEGVAPGSYEIRVTDQSGAVASMPLEIVDGTGAQIGARLRGPNEVRWRDYIFYVNYGNSGDADAVPPLLVIENLGSNSFEILREDLISEGVPPGAAIQLLGIGHDGPAGVLRPGELGSIPVFFRTVFDDGDFRLQVITADDTRPLVFEEIEDQIRPSDATDEEWAEIRPLLMARIGSTWGSYVRALSQAASEYAELGGRSFMVKEIFTYLYYQAPPETNANVYGYVMANNECQPIAGAEIIAVSATGSESDAVTSELRNRFRFSLASGTYTFAAKADGYAFGVQENVEILQEKNTYMNFYLKPQSVITGSVTFSALGPGDTIPNVTAVHEGENLPIWVFAGEWSESDFVIEGLAEGTYNIIISREGYLDAHVTSAVGEGESIDLGTIQMQAEATVTGNVTSLVPELDLENMVVAVFQNGELITSAYCDEFGNYTIHNLLPGDYQLEVTTAPGMFAETISLTITEGQEVVEQNVQLLPGGEITGIVSEDGTGQPLADIPVLCSNSNGWAGSTYTDTNGEYLFSGLPLGTYIVGLPTAGTSGAAEIQVTDLEAEYTADLSLQYVAVLTGIVRLNDGTPVANASVQLLENDAFIVGTLSDSEGRYKFLLNRGGTFDLLASYDGASFIPYQGIAVDPGETVVRDFSGGTGSIAVEPVPVVQGEGVLFFWLYNQIGDQQLIAGTVMDQSAAVANFNNLAAGDYRIVVAGLEGGVGSANVTLQSGEAESLQITLAEHFSLSGTITKSGGDPVEKALISLFSENDPNFQKVDVSPEDGSFNLQFIPAGEYTLIASADGYESVVQTNILVGLTGPLEITLPVSTTTVTGRLVDNSGSPVPFGILRFYDAQERLIEETGVNLDGTFMFDSIAGTQMRLNIRIAGFLEESSADLTITSGNTNSLGDIAIEPVAVPQGKGVDVNGTESSSSMIHTQTSLISLGGWIDSILEHYPQSPNQLDATDIPALPDCCSNCSLLLWKLLFETLPKQRTAWNKIQDYEHDIDVHRATVVGLYLGDLAIIAGKCAKLVLMAYGFAGSAGAVAAQTALDQAGGGYNLANQFLGLLTNTKKLLKAVIFTPKANSGPLAREKIKNAINLETAAIGMASNIKTILTGSGLGNVGRVASLISEINKYEETLKTIRMENVDQAIDQLIDLEGRKMYWVVTYNNRVNQGQQTLASYRNCIQNNCEGCDGDDDGDGDPDPDPDPDGGTGGSSANPPNPPPNPNPDNDPYDPEWVVSADPNDIIGPAGYGEEHWVSVEDTLPYIIRFENMADATAPAQRVVITQQLDEDLDFRTFRVTDFGWGQQYTEVGSELPFYLGRIELTDGSGLVVDVLATVDIVSGVATWVLETIDPATGEPPEDALAGFLPPNDENGIGEGFVSYTIRPRSDTVTWSVIDAAATIVFDTNEPIDTPPVFNTVDAVGPTSSVSEAILEVETVNIFVSWSGEDDPGSALRDYNVYVSTNGGPYTIWLEHTTLTSAWFVGQQNRDYDFYSTARDNAGNVEAFPAAFDAGATIPLYEYDTGDLNHDGDVNLADAILALKVISNIPVAGSIYFDTEVNGDGRIGTEELIYILQKTVGLR